MSEDRFGEQFHSDYAKRASELKEQGVEYLFGFYVDIHGVPKAKAVPVDHLETWAEGSELYTVGALEGMGPLGPNEDECVSIPDLDGLTQLPWDPRYAIAPADLLFHGEPYSHDSRSVLKRQVQRAREMGYTVNVGVETEVYILRETDDGVVPFIAEDLDNRPTDGYDLEATILAEPFLDPMVKYMNELGWGVYSFDHEGGDGQYEFDFAYNDALSMADQMVVFKLMSKAVARSLGCFATYMPKPWSTAFGSGAHINVSLADAHSGANLFEGDGLLGHVSGYSDLALAFTAGVLRHGEGMSAVLCPTVNSYKRLLPIGLMNEISWAPVYRAYGSNNRTLMCRLPMNRRCLEVRTADSACNLYLGLAMTIAAGLEGVAESLDPGAPVNVDTYKASEEELRAVGATRLPANLGAAIDSFLDDPLAEETFGKAFHADYASYKQGEWDEYNTVVDKWETDKYLKLW
jgi:glutamine synthetase